MKTKKIILLLCLLLTTLLIYGCKVTTIKDVKNPDFVGKKVTISGTVQNTIKLGGISGYTIKDDTDTISISSENLPTEGTKTKVTGVLLKDTIFGYYIKAD